MQLEFLIALAAAFVAAALVVLAIGKVINVFLVRYEREWIAANKRYPSKLTAFMEFLKQVLVTEGLKFHSIERIYSQLKIDVVRANSSETAYEYLGQSLLEGVLGFVVGVVACVMIFGPFSLFIPAVLATAWVIWIRPSLINADGEKRARGVYRGIPYALDLSVLVLQAGGTLGEALRVVSRQSGPLAEELRTALTEMDSGAAESVALRNMADRVGLDSLDSIVMGINRGQETGAPMAQTLTTQAELFRERRLQEVEKLAVEAPAKMTFPNMMVMLSVLVIVLGPVLVKISTSGLL